MYVITENSNNIPLATEKAIAKFSIISNQERKQQKNVVTRFNNTANNKNNNNNKPAGQFTQEKSFDNVLFTVPFASNTSPPSFK